MSSSSGSQKHQRQRAAKQAAANGGASTTTSTAGKWTVVRPWQPPSAGSTTAVTEQESELEVDEDLEDEAERGDDASEEDEARDSGSLNVQRIRQRRMQLQVVDVSSTSVSLAVIGQPEEATVDSQDLHPSTQTSTASTTRLDIARTRQRSRSASTVSNAYYNHHLQTQQDPPNISIKLNSAAWPHVFHTDSPLLDADSARQSSRSQDPVRQSVRSQDHQTASPSSSILVWGLSPGMNYHIELGVFTDEPEDQDVEDEEAEVEDLEDSSVEDTPVQASASIRTLDASEPDVPPPPYSSHDPSAPSGVPARDVEASLRAMLDQLRAQSRQAEGTLQSSIIALKRANDKLTREDQRHRQRIHMLEDSTARLNEVAAEEEAESANISEVLSDLHLTERTLASRLARRRDQLDELERLAKEEGERQDAEMSELRERIEKAASREEEVLTKKLRLERELLPTYNIQLATLEADLRRLLDDQRRHYAYGGPVQSFMYGSHSLGYGGLGSGTAIGSRSGSLRQPKRGPIQQPVHNLRQQHQQQQHYYDDLAYTHNSMHSNPAAQAGPREFVDANAETEPEVPPPRSTNILPIGGHRARSTSVTSAGTTSPTTGAADTVKVPSPMETTRDADASSQRTTSRFAWGNSSSWASRVARGGGKTTVQDS